MTEFKKKSDSYYSPDGLMTTQQAVNALKQRWLPNPKAELVELSEALGRRLAVPEFSRITVPVEREAACDGIAVRFSDCRDGCFDTIGWEEGKDYCAADTGDDFADEFDTVIPIEKVTFNEGGIIIEPQPNLKKGMRVRQKGSVVKTAEPLLEKGALLNPMNIALLATGGLGQVPCIQKPLITYIPTGSELVPMGEQVDRGCHTETNGLMTKQMTEAWGADCLLRPIVKDNKKKLEESLMEAVELSDIVIINGGTSMGSEDFNAQLLQSKAEFFQHGVRCMPGMPAALAIIQGKPVINLPGPPFATFCGLQWGVRELIAHWYKTEPIRKILMRAKLTEDVKKSVGFELYLKLSLFTISTGETFAQPLSMGQPFTSVLSKFNAFARIPSVIGFLPQGTEIVAEIAFPQEYQ